MTGVAVVCAVLAAWCLVPAVPRARWGVAPRTAREVARRGTVGVVVAAAVVALVLLPGGRARALGLAGAIVAATGVLFWRRRAAERRRLRTRDEVARACWELAGEVAAGRVPSEALQVVAADVAVLAPAAHAAALGGDVVAAWRAQATEPGAEGLLPLARAWSVSTRTGAPLGPALRRVADELRQRRRLSHTVRGELAAPRATSRLLAGLPLAGVVLGYAMGGDPATFLLDSLAGQVCLVVALALAGTGLLWSEQLAHRAART